MRIDDEIAEAQGLIMEREIIIDAIIREELKGIHERAANAPPRVRASLDYLALDIIDMLDEPESRKQEYIRFYGELKDKNAGL